MKINTFNDRCVKKRCLILSTKQKRPSLEAFVLMPVTLFLFKRRSSNLTVIRRNSSEFNELSEFLITILQDNRFFKYFPSLVKDNLSSHIILVISHALFPKIELRDNKKKKR
jgi:hypothetical protein